MTSATEQLLATLKKEYLDTIPQKIAEIESYLTKKDVESLLNVFHKLKGSGKTYGVDDISVIGQKVEDEIIKNSKIALKLIPDAISTLKEIYENHLPK